MHSKLTYKHTLIIVQILAIFIRRTSSATTIAATASPTSDVCMMRRFSYPRNLGGIKKKTYNVSATRYRNSNSYNIEAWQDLYRRENYYTNVSRRHCEANFHAYYYRFNKRKTNDFYHAIAFIGSEGYPMHEKKTLAKFVPKSRNVSIGCFVIDSRFLVRRRIFMPRRTTVLLESIIATDV